MTTYFNGPTVILLMLLMFGAGACMGWLYGRARSAKEAPLRRVLRPHAGLSAQALDEAIRGEHKRGLGPALDALLRERALRSTSQTVIAEGVRSMTMRPGSPLPPAPTPTWPVEHPDDIERQTAEIVSLARDPQKAYG